MCHRVRFLLCALHSLLCHVCFWFRWWSNIERDVRRGGCIKNLEERGATVDLVQFYVLSTQLLSFCPLCCRAWSGRRVRGYQCFSYLHTEDYTKDTSDSFSYNYTQRISATRFFIPSHRGYLWLVFSYLFTESTSDSFFTSTHRGYQRLVFHTYTQRISATRFYSYTQRISATRFLYLYTQRIPVTRFFIPSHRGYQWLVFYTYSQRVPVTHFSHLHTEDTSNSFFHTYTHSHAHELLCIVPPFLQVAKWMAAQKRIMTEPIKYHAHTYVSLWNVYPPSTAGHGVMEGGSEDINPEAAAAAAKAAVSGLMQRTKSTRWNVWRVC